MPFLSRHLRLVSCIQVLADRIFDVKKNPANSTTKLQTRSIQITQGRCWVIDSMKDGAGGVHRGTDNATKRVSDAGQDVSCTGSAFSGNGTQFILRPEYQAGQNCLQNNIPVAYEPIIPQYCARNCCQSYRNRQPQRITIHIQSRRLVYPTRHDIYLQQYRAYAAERHTGTDGSTRKATPQRHPVGTFY